MKGVSRFVTYAFLILFGFIMVGLLAGVVASYYNKVIKQNLEAGLKQISIDIAGEVAKLYDANKDSEASPENSTLVVLADVDLKYPKKISGKNYEVMLVSSPGIWTQITSFLIDNTSITIKKEVISGSKIIARSTQSPLITYEYQMQNLPIYIQGNYRSGENSTLKFVRYNYNGNITDAIVLGESNVIFGITKVQ